MNIKQTVMIVLLALGVAATLGVAGLTPTPQAKAATCGGVETSLISCEEEGVCEDGSRPEMRKVKNDNGKEEERYLCKDKSEPRNDLEQNAVWGLLEMALTIMTAGVGILAVGGIVYGSILYASAAGNPEQVKKAMGIITNVVVGLIAFALMFSISNFLIPGGIFG